MSINYLSNIISKFSFYKIVVARFFIILFRRRKGIELFYLDYSKEHLFENSFILIRYRFKNAIYYKFGKHKTVEKHIKIFDLQSFNREFDLEVIGFFQKKKYKLKFEPTHSLNNTTFQTTFSNFNLKLEENLKPKLTARNIHIDIQKPIVKENEIVLKQQKIKIANTTFNQNEFI